MKLTQIRKFNGVVLYGYIFETSVVYWSMKLYEEFTKPRQDSLVEYIDDYRFVKFHAGIVL